MGLAPIFCLWDRFVSENRALQRESWLRETLAGLGYELVDLESSRGGLLRVFIKSDAGIIQRQANRIDRLNNPVVQVHTDPFALFENGQPASLAMQMGILNCDPRPSANRCQEIDLTFIKLALLATGHA